MTLPGRSCSPRTLSVLRWIAWVERVFCEPEDTEGWFEKA